MGGRKQCHRSLLGDSDSLFELTGNEIYKVTVIALATPSDEQTGISRPPIGTGQRVAQHRWEKGEVSFIFFE